MDGLILLSNVRTMWAGTKFPKRFKPRNLPSSGMELEVSEATSNELFKALSGVEAASTEAAAVCLDVFVRLTIIHLLLDSCLQREGAGGMPWKASKIGEWC